MGMVARIAILDDDPLLRRLMAEILDDDGYEALPVAHDADADLRALLRRRPDAIILDVRGTPKSGSLRLLAALRDDPVTEAIPVLVTSADARLLAERADWLEELGVWTLAKPFDIDALLATIRALLAEGGSAGRAAR
jgi:DNA-binding response OmpR family regulator